MLVHRDLKNILTKSQVGRLPRRFVKAYSSHESIVEDSATDSSSAFEYVFPFERPEKKRMHQVVPTNEIEQIASRTIAPSAITHPFLKFNYNDVFSTTLLAGENKPLFGGKEPQNSSLMEIQNLRFRNLKQIEAFCENFNSRFVSLRDTQDPPTRSPVRFNDVGIQKLQQLHERYGSEVTIDYLNKIYQELTSGGIETIRHNVIGLGRPLNFSNWIVYLLQDQNLTTSDFKKIIEFTSSKYHMFDYGTSNIILSEILFTGEGLLDPSLKESLEENIESVMSYSPTLVSELDPYFIDLIVKIFIHYGDIDLSAKYLSLLVKNGILPKSDSLDSFFNLLEEKYVEYEIKAEYAEHFKSVFEHSLTPTSIRFLLPFCHLEKDFFSLLTLIESKQNSRELIETAQEDIIRRFAKINSVPSSSKELKSASLSSLIARLEKNSSALNERAVDLVLGLYAKYNSYLALVKYLKLVPLTEERCFSIFKFLAEGIKADGKRYILGFDSGSESCFADYVRLQSRSRKVNRQLLRSLSRVSILNHQHELLEKKFVGDYLVRLSQLNQQQFLKEFSEELTELDLQQIRYVFDQVDLDKEELMNLVIGVLEANSNGFLSNKSFDEIKRPMSIEEIENF